MMVMFLLCLAIFPPNASGVAREHILYSTRSKPTFVVDFGVIVDCVVLNLIVDLLLNQLFHSVTISNPHIDRKVRRLENTGTCIYIYNYLYHPESLFLFFLGGSLVPIVR